MAKFFNGTGENSNSNTYFQNYDNEPSEESTFVGVGETIQNNNDSFASNFENITNNNGGSMDSFVSGANDYYENTNNFVSQDQVANANNYDEDQIKYYNQTSPASYPTYQNNYNNEVQYQGQYQETPNYQEQEEYQEEYQQPTYGEYQEEYQQPEYEEQYQQEYQQPEYEEQYQQEQYQEEPQYEEQPEYQENTEYETLENDMLTQNKEAFEQYYNNNNNNEVLEEEEVEEEPEQQPTTEDALNSMFVPLDAEEKDIIKNPVYIEEDKEKDREVSGNPIACFWVLVESLLVPATSIKKNTEKYVNGNRTIKVYITLMIFYLILYYVGHIIGGCFSSQYSSVKGDFIYVLDFSNLSKLNYLGMFINSLIFTVALTISLAIINYATSFFNNKGQSLSTYLLMCTLSYFPLLLYVNTLFPIFKLFSLYVSIVGLFLMFIYSLFIYGINIKNIMEFKNENRYIRYVMLNYIVTVVLIFVLLYLFKNDMVSQILNTINSI